MNSRQLQYAILLSQKRNFSHVAKELNITQPALSKQILSLETELGIKLFERNSNPIKLTSAGEFFVREAKELLYKEEQLLHSIEQFKSGDKGQLVIGITPFRSAYLISGIIKKIREKFPDVHIKLVEEGSEDLRNDVVDGKFDFAIVNLPVDESLLEIKPIEPDKLALVISNELVEKHPFLKNKTNINFKDCGDISAKIRYGQHETRCHVEYAGEDTLRCIFHEQVRAITPGQAVVFYDGDVVLGGGIIG